MKSKKFLALLLALAMVLSVLAGCGAEPEETKGTEPPIETKGQEETPAVDPTEGSKEIVFPLEETLDATCMIILGNTAYSYNDNLAWQYLEERSNIDFELIEFAPAEATEKMNLLMSSGDYTDILYKANYIDLNQYGMDGILIPLEDLIREYAPNLCKLLDERNGWGDITAPDGHIYQLPMFGKSAANTSGTFYWINQAWLDAVGMDMPTSNEELYQVLKAFKEKDPNGNGIADEIPWAVAEGSAVTNSISQLMCYMDLGLWYENYWMAVDGEMQYAPTTEWFKEDVLRFYAKLYAEGLINEDCYTLTQDQLKAVGTSGANIYGMWFNSSTNYTNEEDRLNWSALKPFNPDNYALNNGISNGGFAITDKCENPEIMIAWVDFLYSEEGGKVLRHGVEGVSYKINEDGTYDTIEEGFEANVYHATLLGSATCAGIIPNFYYDNMNPATNPAGTHDNAELYKAGYGAHSAGVPVPKLAYSEEEKEVYDTYFSDIQTYVRNYVAEAVTGVIDIDATWNEFQDTLKAMHIEDVIAAQQSAYDRSWGN